MSDANRKNVGLPPRRRMRHDRHYVDELVNPRSPSDFGLMVPVTRITSNRDQPRTSLGALDDLVSSIRRHGVLEPLIVRERSDGGGYELISGERRFHAALRAGLEEVPCIELELDDRAALEVALIENLQRKDLSPFEEAEGFS
ncbi:MAG: ParB/RepB/Spo0J family partition protein, partial [Holophagae bacterium]